MDVYKELDRACKKAVKSGLNIKPKHFGLVIREGKFAVRTKNVCLLGALVLGKAPAKMGYAEPALHEVVCETASQLLGIHYDRVIDIICGFDEKAVFVRNAEFANVGKSLREKYVSY